MHSCIYDGRVTHRRHSPVMHQFRYSLFMLYLDLSELDQLTGPGRLIASRRFSLASFLPQDHCAGRTGSIEEATRDLVEQETGRRPCGPIRLLTQLRYFGYYFSPLNLFYCYDASGQSVEFMVAEVNNTPWREQHSYVLWEGNTTPGVGDRSHSHAKSFHVSPFMPMDCSYDWRLSAPGEELHVALSNRSAGRRIFEASLTLQRRSLTRNNLRRTLMRYPLMSMRIVSAIYFQAFRLWIKRCPFYSHPSKQATPATPSSPLTASASKPRNR